MAKTIAGREAQKLMPQIQQARGRAMAEPSPPKTESQPTSNVPSVVKDPLGTILRQRMVRLNRDMDMISQAYCWKQVRRGDYLAYVLSNVTRFLSESGRLPNLMLTMTQIRKGAQQVVDDLVGILQGIPEQQVNINLAKRLHETIMMTIEQVIGVGKASAPTPEKKGDDFLEKLPSNSRHFLESRIRALGYDAKDLPGLMDTARKMGIDVDNIMAKLEQGEIPPELDGIL